MMMHRSEALCCNEVAKQAQLLLIVNFFVAPTFNFR